LPIFLERAFILEPDGDKGENKGDWTGPGDRGYGSISFYFLSQQFGKGDGDNQPHRSDKITASHVAYIMHPKIYPTEADPCNE